MLICKYCEKPINKEILKSFIYKIIGTKDQSENKRKIKFNGLLIAKEYKNHFNQNPECKRKFEEDFKMKGNDFIKNLFDVDNETEINEIKKILNLFEC